MESIRYIVIGIVSALVITFFVYDGIDIEVARRDYVKNVEQCKPIDGCLFGWNCKKYNKMIEEACND